MARQAGPLYFTGTIDDLVFYKLGEHYYVRRKGRYNKKRMQKPGAYPLMHLKQNEFGRASQLASEVYWRQLPRQQRAHGVHAKLTKIARSLLQQGKTAAEVETLLVPLYLGEPAPLKQSEPITTLVTAAPADQPTAKPVTRRTTKQHACTTLSKWSVSAEGRLQKAPPMLKPRTEQNPKRVTIGILKEYCAPCSFSGFLTSVMDRGG